MTQFQHTLKALLEGRKTEISCLALSDSDGTGEFDCEMIGYPSGVMSVQRLKVGADRWKTIWQVGKDYAIQPGRTAKSVGRYRVEAIWRQDVRTLKSEQIKAEGFHDYAHFVSIWCKMHDLFAYELFEDEWKRKDCEPYSYVFEMGDYLDYRPDQYYMAWRMTISVLWETVDWNASAVAALHLD